MVETAQGAGCVDVGERSIMPCALLIVTQVTHGYLTPLTLQPLDQHLLAPHLIHGTVEQRILVLLLLLTNLPLDCVAPRVGTLGIFRCRTQLSHLIQC
jgi:hypothetical protein